MALPSITAQSDVKTNFSGAWTLSSPNFIRPIDREPRKFSYEAIEVDISAPGRYSFTGNSMIQMELRLYDGNFDPTDLSLNLISRSASRYDGEQFRITVTLLPNHRYVLIAMAQAARSVGPFFVAISGSATVALQTARSTPMPSRSKNCFFVVQNLFEFGVRMAFSNFI